MVRALTTAEVRECLNMTDAVEILERAYEAEAAGRAVNIPRSDMILPMGADEAYVFKVMPGAVEDLDVAAIRMQSDRIHWTEERKTKLGVARDDQYAQHVLVYDTQICEPILLIPDGFVSKMRVGATNALGAKYMAPRDVDAIGLLGAGRQAGGQVWGFDTVFDLGEIRVYSPTPESRESFVAEWNPRLDADLVAVESAEAAVAGAEVLAAATNSMQPVFETDLIEPGMHVSAIKNPEVPEDAFEAVDRLAVHTHDAPEGPHNYTPRGSAFQERLDDAWGFETDLTAFPALADLVAGESGREQENETTMFLNNNGAGIQWAACGRHVHDRAAEAGLGEEIDTQLFLQSVW
jgi:ornithine cyclodeaminase/alanine dehydrogenase-like protein (mu-crystallin family)